MAKSLVRLSSCNTEQLTQVRTHLEEYRGAPTPPTPVSAQPEPTDPPRPVSGIETAEIMQLYKSGLTIEAVGRKIGRPGRTVAGVLRRNNAEIRQGASLQDIDAVKVAELYESGLSLASVGEQLQVSAASVRRILNQWNHPIRQTSKLSEDGIRQIVSAYEAGSTLEELMERYGLGNTAISSALKAGGAVMRPRGRPHRESR